MRNIIIDCDPGHDDAIAILMAIANRDKLNILGITTVGGNALLENVTENTLKILSLVDQDIPVASGERSPLIREVHTGTDFHGDSGMDGPVMGDPKFKVVSTNAVKFIYEKIMESQGKVTLVALGPLTNIALLLKTYPLVKEKIELISLMGGGINVGNRTAAAEFNIYVDPEAAKIVFNSGVDIVMAGLDVTNKAMIMDDELEMLKGMGNISDFVLDLLEFYGKGSKEYGFEGICLHDPCAMGYLLKPQLFKGDMYHVDIETEGSITLGMTLADKRPISEKDKNVYVLLDLDRRGFVEYVCDCIKSLD